MPTILLRNISYECVGKKEKQIPTHSYVRSLSLLHLCFFFVIYQALREALVLAFPNFDLPFISDTDASTNGVAALLSQIQTGDGRPVAHAAKGLSKSQKKWPPTKIGMLALNFGTESFFPDLINKKFTAHLDHRSLVWLLNFENPDQRRRDGISTCSRSPWKLNIVLNACTATLMAYLDGHGQKIQRGYW